MLFALLAALSLIAAACGSDDDPETGSDTPSTTEEPGDGAEDPEPTDAPDPTEAPDDPEPTEPDEPTEPSGDSVRIGVLYSNSGPAGVFGPPVANIAQLIEEDVNGAGGINGRPVEVVLADDATDPEVGRQAMEQLLNADNVDVVLGTHSSATREAAKPLAEAANVPYIYAALYEGGECSAVMFNTGEVPSQQLEPAIPWVMEQTGGQKWFLLGNDYAWPRRSFELAREYIEAAGGEVVGEEYVPLGTQDFASVSSQIASSGADLLFPALVGGDAVAFETQAVDFGIGQDSIARLANIYEENVLAGMGPDVTEGMYITLGYFKEVDNAANVTFVERYNETFGADAAPHATFSSHIYDAALLYAAAANAASTTDSDAVIAALEGSSITTPTGDLTITDSRHLTQPIYIAQVQADGSQTIVETFLAVEPDETCSQ